MHKSYDNSSLIQKLGIKVGSRLYLKNPPHQYYKLLLPLPENVKVLRRLSKTIDLFHIFTRKQDDLAAQLQKVLLHMKPTGVIWLSWPKPKSKMSTDLTDDLIRSMLQGLQLVHSKSSSLDETWTIMKVTYSEETKKAKVLALKQERPNPNGSPS